MSDKAYSVEPFAGVLLAIAGLLAALLFLQIATWVAAAEEADNVVAAATSVTPAKSAVAPSAQVRSAVEGLKKNNLFAPPSPKQWPVNDVIGILGSQALINGQWYKVGDSVADAKILAIEPTKVKVVWNGQEKEFTPIGSSGGGGPAGPRQSPRGGPRAPSGAPMVVTGGAPSGGMAPGRSPEEGERLKDLREKWKDMSPEERQKYRDEMRERVSRRSR